MVIFTVVIVFVIFPQPRYKNDAKRNYKHVANDPIKTLLEMNH